MKEAETRDEFHGLEKSKNSLPHKAFSGQP